MAEKRILRAIFIVADKSGPAYHHMFTPAQYLVKHDILKIKIVDNLQALMSTDADIIVMQRQYSPDLLMFVRKLKSQGKVLIAFCDDNVWDLPENNPARQVYINDNIRRYNAFLVEAHGVVTTTPFLKKKIKQFNPLCYVHRNLIVPHWLEFKAIGRDIADRGRIRIGWHLTVHHHDDYKLIEDLFVKIWNKYGRKIKWIFMGYKVPITEKLPPDAWEFYEFVKTDAFYPALANLDFDIGIAPLIDHPFNWGKTHLKFDEYAQLRIPPILSPVLPYLGFDEIGCAVLPAQNTVKAWFECLCELIEDEQKRQRLARNAYHWVIDNELIDKWIYERGAAYYDIYNKATGNDLVIPGYEDIPFDPSEADRIQNLKVIKGINDV